MKKDFLDLSDNISLSSSFINNSSQSNKINNDLTIVETSQKINKNDSEMNFEGSLDKNDYFGNKLNKTLYKNKSFNCKKKNFYKIYHSLQ